LQRKRVSKAERIAQRKALGRAIHYLSHYRREATLPYIFLVVATLSQLAVPRMLGNLIDVVVHGATAKNVLAAFDKIPSSVLPQALPRILQTMGLPADLTKDQIVVLLNGVLASAPRALITAATAITVFAALRGVFAFLQVYWAERNSQSVAFDLRNDLFAKIHRLSFSYHDHNQTGQLMIRATDDVEKVRLFIGQGLLQLAGAVLLLSGTLIILLSTNVRLTMVVLPILPAAVLIFIFFGTVSQPLFASLQAKISSMNTILQENLAGIKLIKAYAREKNEQAKFSQAAGAVMAQQIKLARLFSFLFPLVILIASLGQAAALYAGGRQIIGGTLTLGEWQEFSLYLVFVFFPLAQFGFIITQFGQASASAARIFEILDAKSDVTNKAGAIELPPVRGYVRFENVAFRYFSHGEPVLKNVEFSVEPGQTVALLGATGSGKTTIINLLPRFYDPSGGRITIDGYDLRDVTLESLRSQIGIVLQETTLFAGTIRENIAFGKTDATQEEIEAAAKAAAAHDFVVSFPEGYDTPVGERGATLSGGQKQRIAIARALLLNPRLLILDDSTSNVDLATEAQIQHALDLLMHGRTSFVIAQRLSTVMNADQILVLDKGQIVARGRHAELLEASEIYAEIYSSQLVADAESQETSLPELVAGDA